MSQLDLFYKPMQPGAVAEVGQRYPVQLREGVKYIEFIGPAGDGRLIGQDRWGNTIVFQPADLLEDA